MSEFTKYFPARIFEDRFGPCPILTAYWAVPASSINFQLIAAVPGKFIRIVSLCALSEGATSNYTSVFSPGASLGNLVVVAPSTTNSPMLVMPFNPGGYFDSTQGIRVNMNTSAGTQVAVTIRYIVFGI